MNDIDQARTKARSPQTNGICGRSHKSVLNRFHQVVFRGKIQRSIAELQADLDAWLVVYNHERAHQGKMRRGRTPMARCEDGRQSWRE